MEIARGIQHCLLIFGWVGLLMVLLGWFGRGRANVVRALEAAVLVFALGVGVSLQAISRFWPMRGWDESLMLYVLPALLGLVTGLVLGLRSVRD